MPKRNHDGDLENKCSKKQKAVSWDCLFVQSSVDKILEDGLSWEFAEEILLPTKRALESGVLRACKHAIQISNLDFLKAMKSEFNLPFMKCYKHALEHGTPEIISWLVQTFDITPALQDVELALECNKPTNARALVGRIENNVLSHSDYEHLYDAFIGSSNIEAVRFVSIYYVMSLRMQSQEET